MKLNGQMEQPEILEHILSFLDGKDLFSIRCVNKFWKNVCQYLLKTLKFIECQWYQTHLLFSHIINTDTTVITNNIPKFDTFYSHDAICFLESMGVLCHIAGGYLGRKTSEYNYVIYFTDFLGTTFGLPLLSVSFELQFFLTKSFDQKGFKLFAGQSYKYELYEFDITIFPKVELITIVPTLSNLSNVSSNLLKENENVNRFTKSDPQLITQTAIRKDNSIINCENESKYSVQLIHQKYDIYELEFYKKLNLKWLKINQIDINKFIILRSCLYPKFFYLELDQKKHKLRTIEGNFCHYLKNFVYCPQRDEIIVINILSKSFHLIKKVDFS